MITETKKISLAQPVLFSRKNVETRHWAIALLIGGIIIHLLMIWLLFPTTIDDAYISFHYAKNLSQGYGLVWYPGANPVEGYTNFLWVGILSLLIRTGLDITWMAKIISIGLSLGSILLMYKLTHHLNKDSSGVLPAVLFASSPALALWAVSGLETALFIFLMLISLHRFLIEEESDNTKFLSYWSTIWFMLSGLTRPEGAILFAVLALLRLILWARKGVPRKTILKYMTWLISVGFLCLVYFVWRWQYFGYPLPNTFYVKAQSGISNILSQIGVYIIPYGLRIFPFLLLAVYGVGNAKIIRRSEMYLIAALFVFTMINLGCSDWMAAHRLALPITPLVLLLAHRPLEFFFKNTLRRDNLRQRLTNAVILFGLVLYMIVPFMYTANMFNRVMATQMDMSVYRWAKEMQSIVDGQYVKVGQWLADNTNSKCTVVAGNVGAIAYYSGCNVIDQIGLTHEYIARNGWTVDYLLDQNPDFIVIESDTPDKFDGIYGTGGEWYIKNTRFTDNYELLFVLDNDRFYEKALFMHYLPHATWLYERKDLGLSAKIHKQ